jgi:hypothetical protein
MFCSPCTGVGAACARVSLDEAARDGLTPAS